MITDKEVSTIAALAEQQLGLEQDIVAIEELLKKNKEKLRILSQESLPNAMLEAGMQSFTLSNGAKIVMKTNYFASISKDHEDAAFAWLREHGFGSLVKNQVIAEFGKGEDDKANEWVDIMREKGVYPNHKQSVHAQTLKAFVKEQLTAGHEVPSELFSTVVITESVVSV